MFYVKEGSFFLKKKKNFFWTITMFFLWQMSQLSCIDDFHVRTISVVNGFNAVRHYCSPFQLLPNSFVYIQVENMVAVCQLNTNWFGILFSWTDTKKRSNLMLIVLEPDKVSVPWIGDTRYLGVLPNENIIPG